MSDHSEEFPPKSLIFGTPKREAAKEYFVQVFGTNGNTITATLKTDIYSISGDFVIVNAPKQLEMLNTLILDGVIHHSRKWFSTPIQEDVIRRLYSNMLTGRIGLEYRPEIVASPGDILVWSIVLDGIHITPSSINTRWNVEIQSIEQHKIQMDFEIGGGGSGSVVGNNHQASTSHSAPPVTVDMRKQSMATLLATAKLLEQYRRNLELFRIAEKNLSLSRQKLQELYGPDFETELGTEFAVMNNAGNIDSYLQSQLGGGRY